MVDIINADLTVPYEPGTGAATRLAAQQQQQQQRSGGAGTNGAAQAGGSGGHNTAYPAGTAQATSRPATPASRTAPGATHVTSPAAPAVTSPAAMLAPGSGTCASQPVLWPAAGPAGDAAAPTPASPAPSAGTPAAAAGAAAGASGGGRWGLLERMVAVESLSAIADELKAGKAPLVALLSNSAAAGGGGGAAAEQQAGGGSGGVGIGGGVGSGGSLGKEAEQYFGRTVDAAADLKEVVFGSATRQLLKVCGRGAFRAGGLVGVRRKGPAAA